MKLIKALSLGIAPLILMSYGWYLGQLHQSGFDVAGILLIITGVVGMVLALSIHYFTRKYPWHGKWYRIQSFILWESIDILERLY